MRYTGCFFYLEQLFFLNKTLSSDLIRPCCIFLDREFLAIFIEKKFHNFSYSLPNEIRYSKTHIFASKNIMNYEL